MLHADFQTLMKWTFEGNKYIEKITQSKKSISDKISEATDMFNEMIHSGKYGADTTSFCYTWLGLAKDAILKDVDPKMRSIYDFSFLYPERIF